MFDADLRGIPEAYRPASSFLAYSRATSCFRCVDVATENDEQQEEAHYKYTAHGFFLMRQKMKK